MMRRMMSDMSDKMIEYEESNWHELAEKFIEKHISNWGQFVSDEFCENLRDIELPEEDR